jgi:hypothetical protein
MVFRIIFNINLTQQVSESQQKVLYLYCNNKTIQNYGKDDQRLQGKTL